jgi:hypothetical protein
MIRAVAAVLALLSVCVAAACGGNGGDGGGGGDASAAVDPTEWVEGVCASLVGWRDDIQGASEELQQSAGGSADLEEALSLLTSFLDDAVTRTDALVAEVGDAGSPDVDQGEQISADLQGALQEARDVLAEARDTAEGLPADDPAAFASGAQELAGSIQSGLTDVGGTFDELNEKYDTPELEQAFQDSEACSELQ